jgi:hypothetical protein
MVYLKDNTLELLYLVYLRISNVYLPKQFKNKFNVNTVDSPSHFILIHYKKTVIHRFSYTQ